MPFTLSHIVAVYPLKKFTPKHLSFTALVIGSMVPDFEFFLRVTLFGDIGHTFKGIFVFNLPLTIVLGIIFHSLVRDVLIDNLPIPLRRRFSPYMGQDWWSYCKSQPFTILLSAFIGILSHFAWDNFTHARGYVSPYYLDVLSKEIYLNQVIISVYEVLQHISSVLGLAGFLYLIYKFPKAQRMDSKRSATFLAFWTLVFSLWVVIIFFRYYMGVPAEKPMIQFLVIFIGAGLYSLLITSIILKWKLRYVRKSNFK